jgi:hypothetical protein
VNGTETEVELAILGVPMVGAPGTVAGVIADDVAETADVTP